MGAFEGKVVLITGASSGIGAALARVFVREGAAVALAGRRLERLEALAAELTRAGGRAAALGCDVTRDGDLERTVAATRDRLGPIDVAVANAGFGVAGPVSQLTLDDYRRQFETNVFGVLRTVYAALPDLEKTRGTLVVVGSVSGHLGAPGASAYAMSKFAVRGLAQSLGHELRPRGISVVLVSPGFVVSEIHEVDNRGVHHPGVRHAVPDWLRMPTERAARQIVRAVARRRGETVITAHGKVIVFLQRHAPWLVTAIIRRFGVRGRQEPRRA
ncbi:MAG: SDR family NAD(P)-dependent oxidoreductase [Candidatus Rokubacteria bacterium]|nr:SDR family NAD(P)-dependent oxidoreductase [Candidatus Rokubacteria bacterium]